MHQEANQPMMVPDEERAGGRAGRSGGGAGSLPGQPDWHFVARRIREVNARAARLGLDLEVPAPCGDGRDRDRISTMLMLVLKETRDRDVFELLYLLNVSLLHSFCMSRLRGERLLIDPSDLIEEAFLRIYQKSGTFRQSERATFTGWSFVIVENLIRRGLRRARRRSMGPLPGADAVVDLEPDPLANAMQQEARQAVADSWPTIVRLCAAGLLRLPPRWRRALELREGEDLPYEAIAARMNVSRGHVGMLIRRARRRILDEVAGALALYRTVEND